MATLQIAKVTRYFHNQTDFMAKELFDTLQWGDIGLNGTAALNFIDDDHGELKITSDTHTFPEPFSYIYRYRDNHSVTYSYWYATDIKMRGQDFVILSVTKNWWLTAFVQNPRIYKNLIQTEITWIRSPFFKTWMLDVEDPLMRGVLQNAPRRVTMNLEQYWSVNERMLAPVSQDVKIHWWFKKGEENMAAAASQLNRYAVFIIPATAIGEPGVRVATLNVDGTATTLVSVKSAANARKNQNKDMVVLIPVMNSFAQNYKGVISADIELYMNYDVAGGTGTSRSTRTENAALTHVLSDTSAKWSTYFKGYWIGPPAWSFNWTTPVCLRTDTTTSNDWWNRDQFKGLFGFWFPINEGVPLQGFIPDLTRGANIIGQQLPTPIIVRYFNDPQPNVYILNYMDTRMNGAKVRYGSLIAGARKWNNGSWSNFISDGYGNRNDYVTSGIQTMQLFLTFNGRFIINKRTNYTSLQNNAEQGSYFQSWPTIYLPLPLPVVNNDYDEWLKSNRNQLDAAKNQADMTTMLGMFMGLMTIIGGISSGGLTAPLTLAGLAGSVGTATSGYFKNQQINAQYADAARSLGSSITSAADESIQQTAREYHYFQNGSSRGDFFTNNPVYKEGWEFDSYVCNAENFTKLNNIIFFNGFYGTISSAMVYKPGNMHCCFFQADDVGLFNKISDAVFRDDNSNNPTHEFIKPSYVQALTDAFNTGMRLWYSNPATIDLDLATKQRGVSTIEYEANDRTISMPNSAISSMLTCQHLIVKDKIIANEQSGSQ